MHHFSDKSYRNEKIILVDDNKIISKDEDVAETLNTYFADAVKNLDIKGFQNDYQPDENLSYIENYIKKFKNHPSIIKINENNLTNEVFSFSPANRINIIEEIGKLNINKPTTENNIPAKFLKENMNVCAPFLTNAYNNALTENKFPHDLKYADMTPGYKKDEKTSKKNYRPVSILPTVSKIFERTMYHDIENYMQKFMSPFLCGFRKGFSTQHCLIAMIEKMKSSLDKSHYAAALLTDLSKAFDCINHELLIAKLHAYGFTHSSLMFIHSYLHERKQRTKVNNSYSSWTSTDTGIPQGSILGPLIFNIGLNDIFYFVNKENLTNFADDNTPYEMGKCLECVLKCLEDDANILLEWFSNNYLKMNADKCHLFVPKHENDVYVKIDDEIIKGERSVKLLGLTIDNKLHFNEHVSNLCNKASQKLHALTRIAPYIDKDKLKVLMKAFIESQFNYCPLIWMFHNRTMNNRINNIQERALRITYGDYKSSFEQLLRIDNSFTIHERNLQRLVTEIYKIKNDLAPIFMKNIFRDSTNTYNLCNKTTMKTSNVKTVYWGTETITFRGPQIWALLPENIKALKSLSEFKTNVKKWKPEGCVCRLCRTYIPQLGFI